MTTAVMQRDAAPQSSETFVIAKTDEGFRVCSPQNPARQYVVTGLPDSPRCTCPEFSSQEGDPEYVCSHILAVLHELDGKARPETGANGGSAEPPQAGARKGSGANNNGAVMLLKRSVSPDGRIDSLSVEFSCQIGKMTTEELRQRADKILLLQGEIAAGFLKTNGNAKSHNGTNGKDDPIAVPGQMLGVASMNGRWGRRLFLNILVNGQALKLFGSEKQLGDAVTAAGYSDMAQRLSDGCTLNLPCRVATKPSPDGRYINIERVYPAQTGAPARA